VNLGKLHAVRETPASALLKKRLCELKADEVADRGPVAALLAGCSYEFGGSDSERMHAGKLGRMEMVRWDMPVLGFRIERHEAMGVGSTRAELQDWWRRP